MTGPRVTVALLLVAVSCQKPVKPGDPLPRLSRAERDRFDRGKVVFDSVFTPETGLGPLFNSTACGECHEDPAGGRGDEVEVHATAFRAGAVCDPLVQEGGPVIQQHTTPALKQALGIDEEPFPPSATARAMRTSPVVFGRGLLDLVPDSVLLAYADPADKNHDGVRGRPNRFADGRIGRFGRKGFVPTLREFNAGAFAAEMSVTTPEQPTEEDIGGKPIPTGVDPAADPEITQQALDLADDFVRFLAPPTPATLAKDGRRGRDLFSQIGCASCHIPTLRTGYSPVPA
ncbi:MAG TPA: di-heme oxidoredictase family protein, partial [Gemmatimonadales bacterium]|nr:di-heme oxidoredictase family protein [Gemmatimonadales bacterium]